MRNPQYVVSKCPKAKESYLGSIVVDRWIPFFIYETLGEGEREDEKEKDKTEKLPGFYSSG